MLILVPRRCKQQTKESFTMSRKGFFFSWLLWPLAIIGGIAILSQIL